MSRVAKTLAIQLLVPTLFLLMWALLAPYIDNSVILPSIGDVAERLTHPTVSVLSMGSLLANIGISLSRVLAGYILAIVIAVPLGLCMGYSKIVFSAFNGFLGLFRAIPPLAWVPLVLAWFGTASFASLLDLPINQIYVYLNNIKISMVFIIFIGAFYPILTNAIYGVQTVPNTLIDAAKVLGAKPIHIFYKVLIPAAAPTTVTGLRIGLGVAWMCLVSAEMLPGSISGIGYLITHAYTMAQTDIVVAGMICIGVIGAVMDSLFYGVEKKFFYWQKLTR